MARSERSDVRTRLIDGATRLFAANGYHAVGITRILEEAGVSRVALYHHFRSKEELILAVLRQRDEVTRNTIMREVERAAPDPAGRLLALFDFLDGFVQKTDFTGCMFLNATAEYHSADNPIHRAAQEHKRLMLAYLERLCREGGAAEPAVLARQIYMLFDGAVVQVHAGGGAKLRVSAAKSAVVALLKASGMT